MRDAQRISLKPDEYRDAKALERQQTLRELLAILRRAAASGAEWYYEALETAQRTRDRNMPARAREPVPEVDPDSPFQPPVRALEPEHDEQLKL